MEMTADDERRVLIRVVRQRLDALLRAGIDRLPMAPLPAIGPISRSPEPPRLRPVALPLAQPVETSPLAMVGPSIVLPDRPQAPSITPRPERPAALPLVAASLFGEPELAPVVAPEERGSILLALAGEVSRCTRCPELARTRTQTVFGEGSVTARLMFVGEAPGADEDATGRPFVGRAGTLLTDMITKGMGLERSEVYIANVLKSRPPGNATPTPEEIGNCLPYLEQQIATIRPQFLCLLGKTAILALLETALPLNKLRGKWHKYRTIPTIVTYHPAALLRNPALKKDTWEDLQILMQAMGIKQPDRKKPG